MYQIVLCCYLYCVWTILQDQGNDKVTENLSSEEVKKQLGYKHGNTFDVSEDPAIELSTLPAECGPPSREWAFLPNKVSYRGQDLSPRQGQLQGTGPFSQTRSVTGDRTFLPDKVSYRGQDLSPRQGLLQGAGPFSQTRSVTGGRAFPPVMLSYRGLGLSLRQGQLQGTGPFSQTKSVTWDKAFLPDKVSYRGERPISQTKSVTGGRAFLPH